MGKSGQAKGRPPKKKNVYFRALPESGGMRPLPESFIIMSTIIICTDFCLTRNTQFLQFFLDYLGF